MSFLVHVPQAVRFWTRKSTEGFSELALLVTLLSNTYLLFASWTSEKNTLFVHPSVEAWLPQAQLLAIWCGAILVLYAWSCVVPRIRYVRCWYVASILVLTGAAVAPTVLVLASEESLDRVSWCFTIVGSACTATSSIPQLLVTLRTKAFGSLSPWTWCGQLVGPLVTMFNIRAYARWLRIPYIISFLFALSIGLVLLYFECESRFRRKDASSAVLLERDTPTTIEQDTPQKRTIHARYTPHDHIEAATNFEPTNQTPSKCSEE